MSSKRRKTQNIKVVGVRREEIDTEQLAMVYWMQAKRQIRERKEAEEQAAKEKADSSDYRYWDDEPVRVVPYDLAWPIRFEEEKALLEATIGEWVTGGIHHVGSTAVPGLAAKPVIDILAGVGDLESSRAAFEPLAKLNYLYAPYREEEMHWFCKPDPARRTHHLHLVSTGSRRYQDELAFRDFLRGRPDVALKYQEVKQQLAASYEHDREAYTGGKGTFIALALRNAREESDTE
jgi:GrpB-like predicted nucleotidyltransferase (UPF0157 family)